MKEQIPFTWTLQGEQTQTQSLTNLKSFLFYNEMEKKDKYVMIRSYKRFSSLQSLHTRLRSLALEGSKRERENDLDDFHS